MAAEPIWPGSSSFASGQTPYGFYDSDTEFSGSNANSVDRFAEWAAKRLGYPIVAVELTSGSFYANFEEAVTEYSAQVNQFNITDNLLSLKGQSTGSNLSQKNITPTMGRTIRLAEEYGTAAGVGGLTSFKTGSIQITSGSQVYDFDKLFTLNYTQLNTIWQRARKDLGYADKKFYTIHLCRHTCASRLVQRGVPILLVKDWLGHEDIENTMIYAHLAPKALHSVVDVLND